MTLAISEALDNKLSDFLLKNNEAFRAFLLGKEVSEQELLDSFDEYLQEYLDTLSDEESKKFASYFFLLVVDDTLKAIGKELRRLNLYTPALLAKIKEDLVRGLGGDLKDLQKNIESAQARYYDILKMQLQRYPEKFIEKSKTASENVAIFYAVNIHNSLFTVLESKHFKQVGLNTFFWGIINDGKARATHDERENHEFNEEGACVDGYVPSDGRNIVPKQEPNCRCYRVYLDSRYTEAILNTYGGN